MGPNNHATSRDKKITEPLRIKNQANSWDKKSRNLSGQNEIKQPLGTKKSRNLLGQKNQATSLDKKKSCNLSGQ